MDQNASLNMAARAGAMWWYLCINVHQFYPMHLAYGVGASCGGSLLQLQWTLHLKDLRINNYSSHRSELISDPRAGAAFGP